MMMKIKVYFDSGEEKLFEIDEEMFMIDFLRSAIAHGGEIKKLEIL